MARLISLAQYEAPSMPTEHAVRRTLRRIRKMLGIDHDDPMLPPAGLERASLQGLRALTDPPVDILREALDAEVQDWATDGLHGSWSKVLVLPPCEGTGLVEAWARAAGHAVLPSPPRTALTDRAAPLPELAGAGVLVIPRLEDWIIRRRHGLHLVRALLARLARLERRCLIGCNSWAWRFLVKAAGADALLPEPKTLVPFDAARLKEWFGAHSLDAEARPLTFRVASSGEDILAADDSGALHSGYLQNLAARSQGIPWVAERLWRLSLSVNAKSEDLPERAVQATKGDARTVWVADLDDAVLPQGYEDRSLLALHALLIHDALSAEELDAILPATGEPDVLPALLAAGFVESTARSFRVCAGAYPAARSALDAAGLPLGRM